MVDYYTADIIPIILKQFKVQKIIISGRSNSVIPFVLDYCKDNSVEYNIIDLNNTDSYIIGDVALNVLPDFENYDAIFLNDDPNWYTVYNELKIIKERNKSFPLVFICHNVFPHKKRDSYINPDVIPKEFLNDFTSDLTYGNISINDGFFHATEENTAKNGVLTAIDDFLSENYLIEKMDVKFLDGLTILYFEDSISKIRFNKIIEMIGEYKLCDIDYSDHFIENQILMDYIYNFQIFEGKRNIGDDFKIGIDKKMELITEYENKLKLRDSEFELLNSQLDNFNSKLDLKKAQIKNMESKLDNKDLKITALSNSLHDAKDEISSLRFDISQKEKREFELSNQLQLVSEEVSSLRSDISQKERHEFKLSNQLIKAKNQIQDGANQLDNINGEILLRNSQIVLMEKELDEKENALNFFKSIYINHLSKLDANNYCIDCYKEEISNNHLEIEYLKKGNYIKNFLSPFAYLFLIFKSNPRELLLNFKLYNSIRNSHCFDIGFYLSNNEDIKKSKWCKYFSPELHYVCYGFNEKRKFNKKYFNRNSKKELLDYILNCKK